MTIVGRTSRTCGLVAMVCLVAALFVPSAADATHNGHVLISVDGGAFTADPTGPALDTVGLAPGDSVAADLGVRSQFDVGTALHVELIDVRDDDNGCTAAESRVDRTCGPGQGELGAVVALAVQWSAKDGGPWHSAWTGSPDQLTRPAAVNAAVPARGERWLRVVASVPAAAGNEIQTDTITFGIRVVLSGNGANGHSDIAGIHTSVHPPHRTSASSGVGALAATGLSLVLLIVGAIALLVAGAAMTVAGLSRRRGLHPR